MPPFWRAYNPNRRWPALWLSGTTAWMEGLGQRLRRRARELGLSDAEVARRAGLTATRYGHYVSDYREPDLVTFSRICGVLGMTPNDILAFVPEPDGLEASRAAVVRSAAVMDAATLETAAKVMAALAAVSVRVLTEAGSQGKVDG